jgi:hypothetical protein
MDHAAEQVNPLAMTDKPVNTDPQLALVTLRELLGRYRQDAFHIHSGADRSRGIAKFRYNGGPNRLNDLSVVLSNDVGGQAVVLTVRISRGALVITLACRRPAG